MTEKNVTDFKSMTGPELVAAYNGMIDTALELGITWHVPTRRFSGVAAGIRRCETILHEIQEEATRRREKAGDGGKSPARVKVAPGPPAPARAHGRGAAGAEKGVTPLGPPTLDTRVAVLVSNNPRTTPKTRARFEFWKDGKTIRQYAEEFPHPKGKRESEARALRDFKRAKREGWLGVLPEGFSLSEVDE